MTSLYKLIETGSYTSRDDLDHLVKTLQERIREGKKALRNGPIIMSKIDELNATSIYLEEFKRLRDLL